jgi:hypothetical protein
MTWQENDELYKIVMSKGGVTRHVSTRLREMQASRYSLQVTRALALHRTTLTLL